VEKRIGPKIVLWLFMLLARRQSNGVAPKANEGEGKAEKKTENRIA